MAWPGPALSALALAVALGCEGSGQPAPALAGAWTAVRGDSVLPASLGRDGTAVIGDVVFVVVRPDGAWPPQPELADGEGGPRLEAACDSAGPGGRCTALILRSAAPAHGHGTPGVEFLLFRSREAAQAAAREYERRMRVFVARVQP